MTQYRSQVISPIQIVNNDRIIVIPHRCTGAAQRTARAGAWKRAGAAHRTKPDDWVNAVLEQLEYTLEKNAAV